jgi:hypothetical protein
MSMGINEIMVPRKSIYIPTDGPVTNQRTAPLKNNEDIDIINYLCWISRALRGPARSPGVKPAKGRSGRAMP